MRVHLHCSLGWIWNRHETHLCVSLRVSLEKLIIAGETHSPGWDPRLNTEKSAD